MPWFQRPLRPIDDGLIYHMIHCGNNRQDVFRKTEDFAPFRRTNATGLPYGTAPWVGRLANKLDLDLTIRPRSRTRKIVGSKK